MVPISLPSIHIQFSIDIYPSKNPIRWSEIATPRARGYFGKHAAVAYFDFSKDKYCLTEKHHHDEYIGCFDDEDWMFKSESFRLQTSLRVFNGASTIWRMDWESKYRKCRIYV